MKFKMPATIFLTTLIMAQGLCAEEASSVDKVEIEASGSVLSRARHFTNNHKSLAQGKVLLQLKAKFGGGWQIIGIAHNGGKFNSGYDSFYDSTLDDEFSGEQNIKDNLKIRNLYVQKKINDEVTLQAGALKTDKGLRAMTAMDGNGWIDGARLQIHNDTLGKLTVTAGSIGDLNQTSALDRDFDLNYVEVKLEKEIFENLLVEAGYEQFDNIDFIEFASKYEMEFASERVVTLIAEALYDMDNDRIKASVGIAADLGELFSGNQSGVVFEVRHNYLSENFTARGTDLTGGFTSPGMSKKGSYGTYVLKGNFDIKDKGLFGKAMENTGWQLKLRHEYITDTNYYEVGVFKKF